MLVVSCAALFLLAGPVAVAQDQPAAAAPENAPGTIDPDAIEALKAMGAHLRTLESFGVHLDVTTDEVLDTGQKVESSRTVDFKIRRPDRLFASISSDRKEREVYYDGKTLTMFGPRIKYYASFDAPATIAETLEVANKKHAIELPLADLFYFGTDKYDVNEITSAILIGESKVGGRTCDHYAFQQEAVDWQIWIEQGSAPLPCKLSITSKDDPARPDHTETITWSLNETYPDDAFVFVPSEDTRKIVFEDVSVENPG